MDSKGKISEIVVRCWTDENFKKKFKGDPISVFKEFGIAMNHGVKKITAVENSLAEAYFVIPAKPENVTINEADLHVLVEKMVAGQLVLPTILG